MALRPAGRTAAHSAAAVGLAAGARCLIVGDGAPAGLAPAIGEDKVTCRNTTPVLLYKYVNDVYDSNGENL